MDSAPEQTMPNPEDQDPNFEDQDPPDPQKEDEAPPHPFPTVDTVPVQRRFGRTTTTDMASAFKAKRRISFSRAPAGGSLRFRPSPIATLSRDHRGTADDSAHDRGHASGQGTDPARNHTSHPKPSSMEVVPLTAQT